MDNQVDKPLFKADAIELSVHWSALFDGSLVGEIVMSGPQVNFVAPPESGGEAQTGEDVDWRKKIRELFPLKINRFVVNRGRIHFWDPYSDSKVNLHIEALHATATNLTNSRDLKDTLVSSIEADGRVMHSGNFYLSMDMDPFDTSGTFNLDVSIEDLALTKLNNFLQAYVHLDASAGTTGHYAEVAGNEGEVKGYIKPLVKNVEVLSITAEKDEGFLKVAWEAIVGVAAEVFENQDKDQLCTRIQISGNLNNPNISIMQTFGSLLQNTFISALKPHVEAKINYEDVDED